MKITFQSQMFNYIFYFLTMENHEKVLKLFLVLFASFHLLPFKFDNFEGLTAKWPNCEMEYDMMIPRKSQPLPTAF